MPYKHYELSGGKICFDYEICNSEKESVERGSSYIAMRNMHVVCGSKDTIVSIYWFNESNSMFTEIEKNLYPFRSRFTLKKGFSHKICLHDYLDKFFVSDGKLPTYYIDNLTLFGKKMSSITSNSNVNITSITEKINFNMVECQNAVNYCNYFNKEILCLSYSAMEEHIPVEMLEIGRLVKTHIYGYRKITHISQNAFINDPNNPDRCMYIMKKNKNTKKELKIPGNHPILVDNPNEKEYFANEKIDKKYSIIPSESDLFEKDMSNDFYIYYNFALESNDENKVFGIHVNGILCQTISQKQMTDEYMIT